MDTPSQDIPDSLVDNFESLVLGLDAHFKDLGIDIDNEDSGDDE